MFVVIEPVPAHCLPYSLCFTEVLDMPNAYR